MNMVLKCFEVIKDGKVIAHYDLFKNGHRREVRSFNKVVFTGAFAEQEYEDTLNTCKQIAEIDGSEIKIIK